MSSYGAFAIERYETPKKLKFWFISQKYSKYYNLFRFIINSFFIFFRVSSLSIAKAPCEYCHVVVRMNSSLNYEVVSHDLYRGLDALEKFVKESKENF